jgi:hypothetical protein
VRRKKIIFKVYGGGWGIRFSGQYVQFWERTVHSSHNLIQFTDFWGRKVVKRYDNTTSKNYTYLLNTRECLTNDLLIYFSPSELK